MNEQDKQLADEISKQAEGKQNNSSVPEIKKDILAESEERLAKLNLTIQGIADAELKLKEYEAQKALGGRGYAGQAPVQKTEQEIADEEAKNILKMVGNY